MSTELVVLIGLGIAIVSFLLGRVTANRSTSGSLEKEEEMEAFDPFTMGSSREKRGAARRTGNPVEIYLMHSDRVQPPFQGWVQDRSAGGLRLRAEQEVTTGTVIRARPRQAPPGAPWVDLEVKSCARKDGTWEIGCCYVQAPAWSVQLLFG